jgi:hypothetical protein
MEGNHVPVQASIATEREANSAWRDAIGLSCIPKCVVPIDVLAAQIARKRARRSASLQLTLGALVFIVLPPDG